MFVHEESHSLCLHDIVLPNPLDHSHVSTMCSQPFISPEYSLDGPIDDHKIFDSNVDLGHKDNDFNVLSGNVDDYLSLGYLRGYDHSIDPYYIYLEDLPRKIMWSTFFNPSYDFSKAIYKVKRILVVFGVIFVVSSYLSFSKLWSPKFDKLLCVLTMSAFISLVLRI